MFQVNFDIDTSIAAFFSSSGTSTTREQCDEFARRAFWGVLRPLPFQGMASYTVAAGLDKVVQVQR